MLRSFVTLGRPAAFVTSVALHAGAIAAGGHAAGSQGEARSIALDAAQVTVDIEVAPAPVVPAPEAPSDPTAARTIKTGAPHHHSYPVAPSHDAVPHDPSMVHLPLTPAAPSAVEAQADAPVRFVLSVGSNVATGMHVAADVGAPVTAPVGEPSATYEESQVSVPARLLASTPAEYPAEARAAGLEADVTLELVIDAKGRVVQAKSTSEAGKGIDRAAIDAVRGYRFSPALRAGRPVAVRMRWKVQFRLR
jgi:protein TonB